MKRTYSLSAWLFVRGIGAIFAIAFFSLGLQVQGLWGSAGILPIEAFNEAALGALGSDAMWKLPSVFWFWSGDGALTFFAWFGVVAGLALAFGVLEGWSALVCVFLYTSFCSHGQDFMSFQWDSLLIELGVLTFFIVHWRKPFALVQIREPDRWVRWAFLFSLFKLIFLSGVVKLQSGDPSWRDLTALNFHYWTQPIPNPIAPLLHALPEIFHRMSTALTLFAELTLPFLIFIPRWRVWAGFAFAFLMVLILLSGNFAFFNWLTLVAIIWLIPDRVWTRILDLFPMGSRLREGGAAESARASSRSWTLVRYWRVLPMAFLISISLFWCVNAVLPYTWTGWFYPVARWSASYRINNPYGLFAFMTKSRAEIEIEGSQDGIEWKPYGFLYKPDTREKRPPFIAPLQPRLDWQMWFAALAPYERSPWLMKLKARLLEGSPQVLALLEENPFHDEPPKYIRARLELAEFASPSEILWEGRWWRRTPLRDFGPALERLEERP